MLFRDYSSVPKGMTCDLSGINQVPTCLYFLKLIFREDILVFLTGQEEIETMINKIRQIVHHDESTSHNFRPVTKLIPLPLYASLQSFGQQKVFAPTKPGSRKVILATNIAETSITIPGIRYVIDSCRVKAKWVVWRLLFNNLLMRSLFVKSSDYFFLHRSLLRLFLFLTYRVHLGSIGLDMLQVVRISQAQGLQRTGRAGRQGEGHCYRMLTKNVSQLNEAIVYLLFRLNEQSSLTLSSSRVSRGLLDVLSRYETDVPTLSNHYVGNLCLFLSW